MPSILRDIFGLLARLVIGVVLIAHGYQKLFENGMDAAGQSFAQMGVPAAGIAVWVAALIELIGGILMILGLFQLVVGVLITINMLGAFFIVHISNGVFVTNNGFELVLTIAALALMIATFGSGRIALDSVFGKNKAAARA